MISIRTTSILDIKTERYPIFPSIRDIAIAYHIISDTSSPPNMQRRFFYLAYNFLENTGNDLLNINNIFKFLLIETWVLEIRDDIFILENSPQRSIILTYVDRSFHKDYVLQNSFPKDQGYTLKIHKKKHERPFNNCDIIQSFVLGKIYLRDYETYDSNGRFKGKYEYIILHTFNQQDSRDFYSSNSAIININLPIRLEISSHVPDVVG